MRILLQFAHHLLLIISGLALIIASPSATASFTPTELEELTQELLYIIKHSPKVIREPLPNQYIEALGKRLIRTEFDPQENFYFFLINDSSINAFAGPGGIIGINSGLILASDSESELAAVIAHEIAHVRQKHMLRGLAKGKSQQTSILASSLAAVALGMINPVLGGGAMAVSMSTLMQDSINFTRENEREADRIGIRILYDAGFDPNSMADFFQKLQQNERLYYTDNIPEILRTHPLDYQRIADAGHRASRYAAQPHQDSLNYRLFREQIRVLSATNPQEPLNYYRNKRNQFAHNPVLHYGYGLALHQAGLYQQAVNEFTTLTKNHPNNRTYHIALAEALIVNNQLDNSLLIFDNLYAIYPDDEAIIVKYSQVLLKQGQAQQAQSLLQQATRRWPDKIEYWQLLARAQAANKQTAAAYLSNAEALILSGEYHQALKQLQQAETLTENATLKARITAKIAELD